jgi:Fic family protein
MPALFDLLESENEPAVRAVPGHWVFGYIHPYMDGNGRMARFLMNAMLASGGYPWTVIRVEDRTRYLRALDSASNHPLMFACFLGRMSFQKFTMPIPKIVRSPSLICAA